MGCLRQGLKYSMRNEARHYKKGLQSRIRSSTLLAGYGVFSFSSVMMEPKKSTLSLST